MAIGDMWERNCPLDLKRGGNATTVRAVRLHAKEAGISTNLIDIFSHNGMVEGAQKPFNANIGFYPGMSTWDFTSTNSTRNRTWVLQKGTDIPDDLIIIHDAPEHYTIAPNRDMTVAEYNNVMAQLALRFIGPYQASAEPVMWDYKETPDPNTHLIILSLRDYAQNIINTLSELTDDECVDACEEFNEVAMISKLFAVGRLTIKTVKGTRMMQLISKCLSWDAKHVLVVADSTTEDESAELYERHNLINATLKLLSLAPSPTIQPASADAYNMYNLMAQRCFTNILQSTFLQLVSKHTISARDVFQAQLYKGDTISSPDVNVIIEYQLPENKEWVTQNDLVIKVKDEVKLRTRIENNSSQKIFASVWILDSNTLAPTRLIPERNGFDNYWELVPSVVKISPSWDFENDASDIFRRNYFIVSVCSETFAGGRVLALEYM